MSSKMKLLLGILALVLIVLAASIAYNKLSVQVDPSAVPIAEETQSPSGAVEPKPTPKRSKAPDFTVYSLTDKEVKRSDMLGKPVVLNFWASWCPPCKAEMPDFDLVYRELGEEVAFMMVDMTDGARETKESGVKHILDQGYTFPVYFDLKQEAATAYGIRSIPSTAFIDSEGYIVYAVEGQLTEETLRRGIELARGQ